MRFNFKLYLIAFALVLTCKADAQNITGTWEGYAMGEFFQFNIEQRKNELCGYTWDYILGQKGDYCKARFEGRYDEARKAWLLIGTHFVENSGSHVLMRIILWNDPEDGKYVLKGKVYTQSAFSSIMAGDFIEVKRVSSRPQSFSALVPPCFPVPPKPIVKKPAPTKPPVATAKPRPVPTPAKPVPTPAKPVPATKPPETKPAPVVKAKPEKVISPKETLPVKPATGTDLVNQMKGREKKEENRLQVNVRQLNLKIFDNGIVDGDTVSIFYNGRLLATHQRISETAFELNITLDDKVSRHEIIMFAENLGSIPPNTALLVVTAGTKRYELHSRASLSQNSVLVIEYKPDR